MAAARQGVHTYGQASMLLPDNSDALTCFDDKGDSVKRKTKIICTMGPSCWDEVKLGELIEAGMNICRLNFSHGDHEVHGDTVKRIRAAAAKFPGRPIGILLDTKGPEIRTGFFKEGIDKIELTQGQDLKLVIDYSYKGDNTCIAVSYDKLCTSVSPGGTILCADGSLTLKVKSVAADHVITEVMNSVKLGERKNCNLPGVKVDMPVLQEKDTNDLVNFGIPQGVDFVAASFVQSADDVKMIRKTLGPRGRGIKIISKIENEEGLKFIDEIIDESDGIMVARGDLGMEIPAENVFLAQKMIIAKCNVKGKPVITATQMLESMTSLPRPTRAEASDVANSVLDGTDAVMLSGETAAGSFPNEAVDTMRRIVMEAEQFINYQALYANLRVSVMNQFTKIPSVEAVASSVVQTVVESNAPLIIALTETGHTALMIAKYRPACPILAVSASETTLRQLCYVRGIVPMLTASFVGTDSVITKAITKAKEDGMVKSGDMVVAVHGTREESAGNSNLMKMVTVP